MLRLWPSVLAWAAFSVIVFAILATVLVPIMRADERNARILREGVAAKARVSSIRPTGGHHNEDPEVVITLEVLSPSDRPFAATIETFVSPVHLPRFQPGLTVDVRLDPNEPRNVALVIPGED